MTDLGIFIAFFGGLVSFLSPCVLPLVPAFLAYLAGTSLNEAENKRREIFLASLFFVLGFAAVFSVLGVLLNTLLEAIAYDVQTWLARIGGALIIIFGLYLVELIRLPFLEREFKFAPNVRFGSKYLTSFIFGAAFAAGWTPCVGAVLGGILGLAAQNPGSAFALLFSYSLGLGIPFLLVGFFAARAQGFIVRFAPYLRYAKIIFGIVLILLGVLAFTQNLNRIANLELLNYFLLK